MKFARFLVTCGVVFVLATPASAQKGIVPADRSEAASRTVTKDQLTRVNLLLTDANRSMIEAFKSDEALRGAMLAELKAIREIKDEKQRMGMLRQYQQKYRERYRRVIKRAGIDLQQLASRISQAAPLLAVIVADGTHFVSAPPPPPPSPPSPPSKPKRTQTISQRDFELTPTLSCGGIAGASVEKQMFGMRSEASAVIAAGCSADGEMTYYASVPADQRGTVRIKATATGHLVAYAVAAISIARADAYAGVASIPGSGISTYCSAMTLLAWGEESDCDTETGTATYSLRSGASSPVMASVNSYASGGGVISSTSSTARIKIDEVTLTIE